MANPGVTLVRRMDTETLDCSRGRKLDIKRKNLCYDSLANFSSLNGEAGKPIQCRICFHFRRGLLLKMLLTNLLTD